MSFEVRSFEPSAAESARVVFRLLLNPFGRYFRHLPADPKHDKLSVNPAIFRSTGIVSEQVRFGMGPACCDPI